MCKFIEEEIDYSEAANEQGWEEKKRKICALKRKSGEIKESQEDICCRFAETNDFTQCGNYRAQ